VGAIRLGKEDIRLLNLAVNERKARAQAKLINKQSKQ
jgi:hypothetical protein